MFPVHDLINFPGPFGRINATVLRPSTAPPHPAVLLLQEGIGVTPHLLRVAEWLAAEDYLVLVPDLYSRDLLRQALTEHEVVRGIPIARSPRRVELLSKLSARERASAERVAAWYDGRDDSSYFPDVQTSLTWLQAQSEVKYDAIAALGFSVGGGLAAKLTASGADLAAGVIFYGGGPHPESASRVCCPLQGHYAERDAPVTPHVQAVAAALEAAGQAFTAFIYAGTEHGFFNETRPTYARDSAELAWARAVGFLRQHLRSGSQPEPRSGTRKARERREFSAMNSTISRR
ncbi:MAG TPA: dienelactone hydrolase family protein [Polyangiaceae bacterium]|nr:dienelactone hydrolase family protein [Polyangiaceae bacterium]